MVSKKSLLHIHRRAKRGCLREYVQVMRSASRDLLSADVVAERCRGKFGLRRGGEGSGVGALGPSGVSSGGLQTESQLRARTVQNHVRVVADNPGEGSGVRGLS